MIHILSLNPAIDRTIWLESLKLGDINRADAAVNIPGGKGVNVAKVLRKLNMSVLISGFIGGNPGRTIEEYLEEIGANCAFTKISNDTRINTNIIDNSGAVTEVLDPGPVITVREYEEFCKAFIQNLSVTDILVLTGSIPKGIPVEIYKDIIETARKFNIKTILDASGDALKAGIEAKPNLVKPNSKELSALINKNISTDEDIREGIDYLLNKGIQKVVVSLGDRGAVYGDSDDTFLTICSPKINALNTVGCGDTMVASIASSFLNEEETDTMIKKAVALASASAATKENGDFSMELYFKNLEEM